MRSNFKPWGTYFRKMFEEIGNIALEHQKLRKFRLITLEFKKKIDSNFDDFRLPQGRNQGPLVLQAHACPPPIFKSFKTLLFSV